MVSTNESMEDILRHFINECSLYKLNPGSLESEENGFSQKYTYASLYFTNCSTSLETVYGYYYDKTSMVKDGIIMETKDQFTRSVILVNFAICTIVVSAWLLLIVQFLSVKSKPTILKLTTLLLAVTQTVTLVKLSDLMKLQFLSCYQDRSQMTADILDSLDNLIPLFITQIAIFWNMVEIARELLSRFSLKGYLVGLHYVHVAVTVLDLVFFGINFFTPGHRTDSFHDWVNLGMIVTSSYCYVHLLLVYAVFIIFKSSFSFKFKNLVQIVLIFLLLVFAISLNIIWITTLSQNLKWILPIFLFALTATITMIYELLNNIEEFDHKVETKGIVGREIFTSANEIHSKRNQLYSNFTYNEEAYQDDEDEDDGEEMFERRATDIESHPEIVHDQMTNSQNTNEAVITGSSNEHPGLITASNNTDRRQQVNDIQVGNLSPTSCALDDNHEPPPAFEPDNGFEIGDYDLNEKRRL